MADARLSAAARAFRAVHALIAVAFLLAIAYVWLCALTGRRDGWLRAAVVSLLAEGAFVAANRGDCPLGPLQDRLGDPVPLFELLLSPTAARRAVPVLGTVGRRRRAAAGAPRSRPAPGQPARRAAGSRGPGLAGAGRHARRPPAPLRPAATPGVRPRR